MSTLKAVLLTAAFSVGFPCGAALAGSEYSANDIVKFFQSSVAGAERGICVGTVQECEADAPKPAGFDMLINFELDSADLTPQAKQNLVEFARALKDDRLSSASFDVEGFTDASGGEVYNQSLSERRAQSVTAFLLDSGVPTEKVRAIGMGEAQPRNADPFSADNRRVEMRVRLQQVQ